MKTLLKAPLGMTVGPGERCVSFDGDADRIVYFHQDSGIERIQLLCILHAVQ